MSNSVVSKVDDGKGRTSQRVESGATENRGLTALRGHNQYLMRNILLVEDSRTLQYTYSKI